jgi:hypothetical protein
MTTAASRSHNSMVDTTPPRHTAHGLVQVARRLFLDAHVSFLIARAPSDVAESDGAAGVGVDGAVKHAGGPSKKSKKKATKKKRKLLGEADTDEEDDAYEGEEKEDQKTRGKKTSHAAAAAVASSTAAAEDDDEASEGADESDAAPHTVDDDDVIVIDSPHASGAPHTRPLSLDKYVPKRTCAAQVTHAHGERRSDPIRSDPIS